MVISETDTFRQRQAAQVQKGEELSVFVTAAMGTSLCMEKLLDQLTCICEMPPPPSFCEVLCRLAEGSELGPEAGLVRWAQHSQRQSQPAGPASSARCC